MALARSCSPCRTRDLEAETSASVLGSLSLALLTWPGSFMVNPQAFMTPACRALPLLGIGTACSQSSSVFPSASVGDPLTQRNVGISTAARMLSVSLGVACGLCTVSQEEEGRAPSSSQCSHARVQEYHHFQASALLYAILQRTGLCTQIFCLPPTSPTSFMFGDSAPHLHT